MFLRVSGKRQMQSLHGHKLVIHSGSVNGKPSKEDAGRKTSKQWVAYDEIMMMGQLCVCAGMCVFESLSHDSACPLSQEMCSELVSGAAVGLTIAVWRCDRLGHRCDRKSARYGVIDGTCVSSRDMCALVQLLVLVVSMVKRMLLRLTRSCPLNCNGKCCQ